MSGEHKKLSINGKRAFFSPSKQRKKTETLINEPLKEDKLCFTKEYTENAYLHKPVLKKIITTRE